MGLSANAFGQAVGVAIQLLSLPLFLLFWDTSTYGAWLLLSALPAYLTMADLGMVAVAGNKMTIALGKGDAIEANRVFQSAQLFTAIVSGALAAIAVPLALFVPLPNVVSMNERIALAALACTVLAAQYGGLCDGVFRATGRYALGTAIGPLVRVAEFAAQMLGLYLFRSFAGVALCGLFARISTTAVQAALAMRGAKGLRIGFAEASRAELASMVRPAISFMAFPLANALTFQGVTLLVGGLAGTAAVTVFNAYRTIARVAVQITGMLSLTLWPEFSRAFGAGGMAAVYPLYRRTALLGAGSAVLFSVFLYFISPTLLRFWTHGRIEFQPSLMGWLLAYAAVAGSGYVPRVVLMSTNKHSGIAGWSIFAGALAMGLAWGFGLIWRLDGVGAAMLASELFIAVVCTHLAQRAFAKA